MHISPLLPRLQPHHNPHPDPTKPPPPSPGQEGLFQLHFKLKSSSSTAVEAPCDPLSNSTVQKKKKKTEVHERCVGAAEILFNLYNKKGTSLSRAALPKEGSVCF